MSEEQLLNIQIPNESAERFASRQLIFAQRSRFSRLFMHPFSRMGYVQYGPYTIDDYCDLCNAYGCCVCDGTGKVRYYFNSEPNEPNVIGINSRMVND